MLLCKSLLGGDEHCGDVHCCDDDDGDFVDWVKSFCVLRFKLLQREFIMVITNNRGSLAVDVAIGRYWVKEACIDIIAIVVIIGKLKVNSTWVMIKELDMDCTFN